MLHIWRNTTRSSGFTRKGVKTSTKRPRLFPENDATTQILANQDLPNNTPQKYTITLYDMKTWQPVDIEVPFMLEELGNGKRWGNASKLYIATPSTMYCITEMTTRKWKPVVYLWCIKPFVPVNCCRISATNCAYIHETYMQLNQPTPTNSCLFFCMETFSSFYHRASLQDQA